MSNMIETEPRGLENAMDRAVIETCVEVLNMFKLHLFLRRLYVASCMGMGAVALCPTPK